jgi:hypothetical protein
MSSKGGGQTDVQMEIRPDDFTTLIELMCLVDRQAAMEALSAELSRQIGTQPQRDENAASTARTEPHGVSGRLHPRNLRKNRSEKTSENAS